MTNTHTPDIEELLAQFDLEKVLQEHHVTIVDSATDPETAEALLALQREEKELAATEAAAKKRREAIRSLIKAKFASGDEALIVVNGAADDVPPVTIAKMVYPEQTVRVNVDFIKENFPRIDYPEMWLSAESTPRMTVVAPQ